MRIEIYEGTAPGAIWSRIFNAMRIDVLEWASAPRFGVKCWQLFQIDDDSLRMKVRRINPPPGIQ